jgi:hypothetical protein
MLHYFTEFIINVQKEDNITIYFWRKKNLFNDLLETEMFLFRRRNMRINFRRGKTLLIFLYLIQNSCIKRKKKIEIKK